MRFGKKQQPEPGTPQPEEVADHAPDVAADAPRDLADLSGPDLSGIDLSAYVDLGSLLIPLQEGLDVQLQVDDATGQVVAAIVVMGAGAMEVRAFAAARGGDLWASVRPDIVADATARGGTAVEVDGVWGPELACELPVQHEDGSVVPHPSRVVGFDGPRWLLRAAFMGEPAVDADARGRWQAIFCGIVVRRGTHAVPPGEPLALTLPAQAQRLEVNGG